MRPSPCTPPSTTHGWVGDNPHGYTTNYGFHSYVDTTVLGIHHLSYESIKAAGGCSIDRTVDKNDPWPDVLAHIQRSFDQMRPLYELQKSGDLEKEPGKKLITERLCDGGAMLGAMYAAAWEASAMTDKDVADYLKYEDVSSATPNPMEQHNSPRRDAGGANQHQRAGFGEEARICATEAVMLWYHSVKRMEARVGIGRYNAPILGLFGRRCIVDDRGWAVCRLSSWGHGLVDVARRDRAAARRAAKRGAQADRQRQGGSCAQNGWKRLLLLMGGGAYCQRLPAAPHVSLVST